MPSSHIARVVCLPAGAVLLLATLTAPALGEPAGTTAATIAAEHATLDLTPTAVGRIAVGGPARAAEKMLRATLGPPDRTVDGKGCELDAPADPRRTLTWGALTVSLAPAGTGRLVGWTIGAGRIPPHVTLPHGVTTATTVRDALRVIPGARASWDEVFQMYWITAPAEPAMMWAGDHEDGSGRIAYITNAFEACE